MPIKSFFDTVVVGKIPFDILEVNKKRYILFCKNNEVFNYDFNNREIISKLKLDNPIKSVFYSRNSIIVQYIDNLCVNYDFDFYKRNEVKFTDKSNPISYCGGIVLYSDGVLVNTFTDSLFNLPLIDYKNVNLTYSPGSNFIFLNYHNDSRARNWVELLFLNNGNLTSLGSVYSHVKNTDLVNLLDSYIVCSIDKDFKYNRVKKLEDRSDICSVFGDNDIYSLPVYPLLKNKSSIVDKKLFCNRYMAFIDVFDKRLAFSKLDIRLNVFANGSYVLFPSFTYGSITKLLSDYEEMFNSIEEYNVCLN